MAVKNPKNPQFDKAQFLSYAPDKKMTAQLKAMPFGIEDFDSALMRLHEEGYKVTFREDTYNECWACWIIPVDQKHRHNGLILSGRGSTPHKALKQACFIHWNLWEGDWIAHSQIRGVQEIDD